MSASDGIPPRLEAVGLSKAFGGAQALDGAGLTVAPGEVHGLLGQNGSGKSTLIKILAGFHAPDAGTLAIDGRPVDLPLRPGQFRQLGMEFVHQDLGLVESLSVVDNFTIAGMIEPENAWHTSWRAQRAQARDAFRRYGVAIDLDALVSELPSITRAMLAIIRAVEGIASATQGAVTNHGLLVLDEPTVFLPKSETEQLFGLLREITTTGGSVLFVSHDLDQVRAVTERVTVLRDGRVVATVDTAAADEAALIEMIVGRAVAVSAAAAGRDAAGGDIELEVDDLSGAGLAGISFHARRGEILGLTGLAGSGFDSVVQLLFGARRARRGRLRIGGRSFDLADMTPRRAIELGIALIPADRKRDGSVGSLPAADNVMLTVMDRYRSRFGLSRRRMLADAGELMRRFDVRPTEPMLPYSAFSGGNQQKLMLAKWLQLSPSVMLLEEPTQGVDVGARQQIYDALRDVAAQGTAIVCASADYDQLETLCDRVVVIGRGRVSAELRAADVTHDAIVERCYASAEAVAHA